MRQCPSKLRRPGLLAIVFAVALTALACAFALPTATLAEVDTSTTYNCAHVGFKSFDNQHLQDAVDEAANSGATLFMTGDWNLGDKLYVPEGKKVTVDMDGHRIEAGKCQVFCARKGRAGPDLKQEGYLHVSRLQQRGRQRVRLHRDDRRPDYRQERFYQYD